MANSAPSLDTKPSSSARPRASTRPTARPGWASSTRTSCARRCTPTRSRLVREATVAIEDRRFYEHQGVDFEGIVRAAVKNLESKKDIQGGSTLTMQLVRNLYTGERARNGVAGYKRKIREAKLAQELEDRHPGPPGKLWIVNKYVNSVPYGSRSRSARPGAVGHRVDVLVEDPCLPAPVGSSSSWASLASRILRL